MQKRLLYADYVIFLYTTPKELTEKILEFKSLIRGQFKHIYPMIFPDDSKNQKEN